MATSGVYKPLVADAVFYKPSVAYVDGRSQALGGRWSHLQAFRGIRGSSCTSISWNTWIVLYKAFGGVRGKSCRSLWWHTWIVVCKFLVPYVDRRSQAFGGRWSRLQAFGGISGLSCISLSWHTWIVVCKASRGVYGSSCRSLLGIRGLSIASLWWQMEPFTCLWWYTWIVVDKPLVATSGVYKPLVADGVVYKPLVACLDCRSKALGGR